MSAVAGAAVATTGHSPRDSPPAGRSARRVSLPASRSGPPTTSRRSSTPVSGAFARFVVTETSVASSPVTSARGPASRATSGFVTSVFSTARPTSVFAVAPRLVSRHVVRLSGQVNETSAVPVSSVCTAGAQKATSRKSLRSSRGSPLAAPP